ncbi:MAG TPA: thiamine-phosphate synthase family protein [Candidatus Deferrimicrobium sp.]|nr:thiamine-phosphate synthase family protein [Candidatus Deferrimicrobium sp.]
MTQELKEQILGNLVQAIEFLRECKGISELIPEVRMNIAYALPNAKSVADIAAIPGRITTYSGTIHVYSYPAFGASDHLARALLEVQKYDASIRAVINFKYTPEFYHWLQTYCQGEHLTMVLVDRAEEPHEASSIDGQSMPWKIKKGIGLAQNKVPDIIGENEALGKEPLFKLFGQSATDVAKKLVKIANAWIERI